MAMQKVVSCKVETSITGQPRYRVTLACGCVTTKPCRWNRKQYVPVTPKRMVCSRHTDTVEEKGQS